MRKASVLQAAFSASLTAIVELRFEEGWPGSPVEGSAGRACAGSAWSAVRRAASCAHRLASVRLETWSLR